MQNIDNFHNIIQLNIYSVLDLREKQRGVSNVIFTYFDYFFGVQYKLGGLRGTRAGGGGRGLN